jgi:hypothetical protein
MLDVLDRRIRQMHAALEALEEQDFSSITLQRGTTAQGQYCKVDFAQGTTESGLANIASLIIANIACMKDHLRVWCTKSSSKFDGEDLINTNRDVAIIHDLWNVEKHGQLNRTPRSGHCPRVQNLTRSLRISTGTSAGSSAVLMFNLQTGKPEVRTEGGGSASLVISGDVVDENGVRLGDFETICESATAAWEEALKRAGVQIPSP